MLHIGRPVWEFILTQSPDAQQEILQALRRIEQNPLSGEYLPFPYVPGVLGYGTAHYFINYRLTDGIPEVAGIIKMPTADDIQRIRDQGSP